MGSGRGGSASPPCRRTTAGRPGGTPAAAARAGPARLRGSDLARLSPGGRSVGPRHPEDVLAHERQHQVVVDRRGAVEPRLAELALDVVLLREAVAPVGV